MKQQHATQAFAALAHALRLSIYRLLVEAGPGGMAAGAIAQAIGTSPSGLSFHAAQLERAGLIAARREGRSIRYRARFDTMNQLLGFLTDQCCHGHPEVCRPTGTAAEPHQKESVEQ